MRGSGFPGSAESAGDWATINEATSPLAGNLPNEVAAAVEALQMALGADPSDLTDIGWGGSDPATVAGLVALLCRYEVGTFTFSAATASQAVTFTNAARFTSAGDIKVFLFPERVSAGAVPSGNDSHKVDSSTVTTSGFTAWRNISGTALTGQRTVKYIAIQWPD